MVADVRNIFIMFAVGRYGTWTCDYVASVLWKTRPRGNFKKLDCPPVNLSRVWSVANDSVVELATERRNDGCLPRLGRRQLLSAILGITSIAKGGLTAGWCLSWGSWISSDAGRSMQEGLGSDNVCFAVFGEFWIDGVLFNRWLNENELSKFYCKIKFIYLIYLDKD